jgi:hypothetical protein
MGGCLTVTAPSHPLPHFNLFSGELTSKAAFARASCQLRAGSGVKIVGLRLHQMLCVRQVKCIYYIHSITYASWAIPKSTINTYQDVKEMWISL